MKAGALLLVLLVLPCAFAEIYYVDQALGNDAWSGLCAKWDGNLCGPKLTIQAAIDAAADGDEISVESGVYDEAIDLLGKALHVYGVNGAATTIIFAVDENTSAVTAATGEGPASVLEGFTIQGGTGTPNEDGDRCGGGVYCAGANPTLAQCWIVGNAADYGGGVYCAGCDPTLTECWLVENTATHGAGLYCTEANPTVVDGLFLWNSSEMFGGAVYCREAVPTLTRCLVFENWAGYGGGVYAHEADAKIADCVFTWNVGDVQGGALHGRDCQPILTGCTITNNSAWEGGGLFCDAADAVIVNCTFYGNWAYQGGSLYCYWGASPALTSSILWGSSPDEISVVTGDPVVRYCDVRGGWVGEGNIAALPRFADVEFEDFHLTGASACIDAGLPDFDPPGATDADGLLRVWDGDGDGTPTVDMGAYEHASHQRGDVNCDESLDVFDIDVFVVALTDAAAYAEAYPDCATRLADANADGAVNAFDIDAFVELLTGG